MPLRTGHAPQRIGQAAANGKDREYLNEIRKRGRILKRMCTVCVEETAAIGAELLNDFLRSHRTLRDVLRRHRVHELLSIGTQYRFAACINFWDLHGLNQFRGVVRLQVLHHAL